MGRNPRRSDDGFSRGAWTATEDKILLEYIKARGEGRWSRVSRETGLKRCGKSCRLRWMNYLRPDIKRGNISTDEEELIIRLHKLLGNRWSLIAGRLPGRTDNEIKNYWNTNLGKKASELSLSQLRITSLKSQSALPNESGHSIPVPVPQQATQIQHCKNTSNPDAGQPHYNMVVTTQPIGYDSDSSGGTPLSSMEDLMMNFNVHGDDICQILECDFPNQVYLEGLLSPEPELEIEDYLNMVEEQGFRNRFSSCLVSEDTMVMKSNGVGEEDCILSSDHFGSGYKSDHAK